MKPVHCVRTLSLLAPLLGMLLIAGPATAQAPPSLPSETPAQFTPVTDSFDYTARRSIPMRDGEAAHCHSVPKAQRTHPYFHPHALRRHRISPLTSTRILAQPQGLRQRVGSHSKAATSGSDVRGKYGLKATMHEPPPRPAQSHRRRSLNRHHDQLITSVKIPGNGKVGILGILRRLHT
jgi:hypothetical protein